MPNLCGRRAGGVSSALAVCSAEQASRGAAAAAPISAELKQIQPLVPEPARSGAPYQVESTTVMDKTVQMLMPSTSAPTGAPLRRDAFSRPRLRAEHGVSMLVTVHYEGKR